MRPRKRKRDREAGGDSEAKKETEIDR